jgi:hypothetical protein
MDMLARLNSFPHMDVARWKHYWLLLYFISSLSKILGNLLEQACISEPVRIIHYALDGVRQLFCNRGTERGRETGIETVNTTGLRTGEKESSAEYDCNQQWTEDDIIGGDDDDLHSDDYDYDDDEEVEPCLRISYDAGDSYNIKIAYSFSRYLVEVLSVRPRFPFSGTFIACNDCSAYCFSPQKGPLDRNVDSQVLSMHSCNILKFCFPHLLNLFIPFIYIFRVIWFSAHKVVP